MPKFSPTAFIDDPAGPQFDADEANKIGNTLAITADQAMEAERSHPSIYREPIANDFVNPRIQGLTGVTAAGGALSAVNDPDLGGAAQLVFADANPQSVSFGSAARMATAALQTVHCMATIKVTAGLGTNLGAELYCVFFDNTGTQISAPPLGNS